MASCGTGELDTIPTAHQLKHYIRERKHAPSTVSSSSDEANRLSARRFSGEWRTGVECSIAANDISAAGTLVPCRDGCTLIGRG